MSVTICDVGPRDGLQNEPDTLAPQVRAALCRLLDDCGLERIEAVSFVRDDRVPQMAGAEEVLRELGDGLRATVSGLVLNAPGMERALAAGLREVHVAVMATDGFSRVNTGMTVTQALGRLAPMVTRAGAAGARVTGTVSVAFGCQHDGRVTSAQALAVASAMVDAGVDELVLADTIGVATPRAVGRLVRDATGLGRPVGVHLHDTRNTATANSLAALEAGATIFETSIGGLGGCPFSPGATGNLATEDLVHLFEGEGVATGLDLDGLISISHWLQGILGRRVPGALAAAGRWWASADGTAR
jgi:hydroxymethylglutaryl-CoA lyase/(R)-citramalyl-CoA lyase